MIVLKGRYVNSWLTVGPGTPILPAGPDDPGGPIGPISPGIPASPDSPWGPCIKWKEKKMIVGEVITRADQAFKK